MSASIYYQGAFCCNAPKAHARFERQFHGLRLKFNAIKRDEGVESDRGRRRSLGVSRDLDVLKRDLTGALTLHPALEAAAEDLKIQIGKEVFGVADKRDLVDITLTSDNPEVAAIDRQIELAQAALEASQLQIERLEADREKALNRPQDIFEPGTYLVAERREAVPWRRVSLYRKDEDGRWFSTSAGSTVHWNAVQHVLEDEGTVVYNVETMREI